MRAIAFAGLLTFAAPFLSAAIIDGSSSFDFNEATPGSGGASSGGSNFVHNGTAHLFAVWWFIRGPGDGAELAFPAVTSQVEAGNVNTLSWGSLGTAAGPVSATSVFTLTNSGGVSNLDIGLTLDYTGTDPVVYDVYLYVDLDLNGTPSGDSITGDINGLLQTDGNVAALVTMANANGFQVTSFSSLRSLLGDGGVTNLNGTGVPFGPGDGTLAFQSAITFTGAGSQGVSAAIEISDAVPEPSTLMLTGIGLLALGFARRRFAR